MTFRITHVDCRQRRRQLLIEAGTRSAAEAEAVLRCGHAVYLAVITLRRPA